MNTEGIKTSLHISEETNHLPHCSPSIPLLEPYGAGLGCDPDLNPALSFPSSSEFLHSPSRPHSRPFQRSSTFWWVFFFSRIGGKRPSCTSLTSPVRHRQTEPRARIPYQSARILVPKTLYEYSATSDHPEARAESQCEAILPYEVIRFQSPWGYEGQSLVRRSGIP
ncbi:hypothetical protein RRG08_061203 [Elysia crispata]|uniref:Uncharacterized protein n=1 Tax=Elysia crispata TaxID=231223 RepID=A0AAE0ZMF5_9GAST|nr:hypothetical protein RRG08_061203 [Elysia crispata]